MGDRGNIVVKDEDGQIFLYTHWTGSDLPGVVARGLSRGRDRWKDSPYLTRILHGQMLLEGYRDDPQAALIDTTGFGISPVMGDGGTEVYVNPYDLMVTYDGKDYSFDEFVAEFENS